MTRSTLDAIICLNDYDRSSSDEAPIPQALSFLPCLAVLFLLKSCFPKAGSRKTEERQPVEQSASFIMRAMRAL